MGGMLVVKFVKYVKDKIVWFILINFIGFEDYLKWVDFQDLQVFLFNEFKKILESICCYQQKNYYDGKWWFVYQVLFEFYIGQLKYFDYLCVVKNNVLIYNFIFSEFIVYDLLQLMVLVFFIIGICDCIGFG